LVSDSTSPVAPSLVTPRPGFLRTQFGDSRRRHGLVILLRYREEGPRAVSLPSSSVMAGSTLYWSLSSPDPRDRPGPGRPSVAHPVDAVTRSSNGAAYPGLTICVPTVRRRTPPSQPPGFPSARAITRSLARRAEGRGRLGAASLGGAHLHALKMLWSASEAAGANWSRRYGSSTVSRIWPARGCVPQADLEASILNCPRFSGDSAVWILRGDDGLALTMVVEAVDPSEGAATRREVPEVGGWMQRPAVRADVGHLTPEPSRWRCREIGHVRQPGLPPVWTQSYLPLGPQPAKPPS